MKNKYLLYFILSSISVINVGCKDKITNLEPTALELQITALMNNNSSWGLNGGTVMKDGYEVTSQFDGFVLMIGEFTYTTQNALSTAWPASGTWQFVNENPNKVERGDGVEIDINIANNQLTLKYSVTDIGGKVKGINGVYQFNLTSN